VHCPHVAIAHSGRVATQVEVIHMSCQSASRLIATAPVARYVRSGGRFMESGFRCGTEGLVSPIPALFDCQSGQREFLYQISG